MTAQILDGKATAAAIKAELSARVEALKARGIVPGLGTLLVGDDPASASYVRSKHRDCAQVGIASIQRELPATATQAQVAEAVAAAERGPGLHRLHRPAAAAQGHRRERRSWSWSTRTRTPTACTRPTSAGSCSAPPAPLPCTPLGIVELLRRHDVAIAGAEVVDRRPRHHRGPPARPAADPPQRERDRDAVPHRHPRPGRAHAAGGHRGGRGRRAEPDHRRPGQAGRGGAGRRRRRAARAAWPATSRTTCATWPAGCRRTPAASGR